MNISLIAFYLIQFFTKYFSLKNLSLSLQMIEKPRITSEKVADFQLKLKLANSNSSKISNENFNCLFNLQSVNRQMSIIHSSILGINNGSCNYTSSNLNENQFNSANDCQKICALLLAGNIQQKPKIKEQYVTKAFKNQNIVNQAAYLITFLRDQPKFTAKIFFKAMKIENYEDAKFISFSTIPALYQNGWCIEENNLWMQFLDYYTENIEQSTMTIEKNITVISEKYLTQKQQNNIPLVQTSENNNHTRSSNAFKALSHLKSAFNNPSSRYSLSTKNHASSNQNNPSKHFDNSNENGKNNLLHNKDFKYEPHSNFYLPLQSFFISKLSLDYLPMAVAPTLNEISHDFELQKLRVVFEFDAAHMVPLKYIQKLFKYAQNIVEMLELHLNRVPLSIRRFLLLLSEKTLKFGEKEYTGNSLSTFFFLSCCLLPIIKEPQLIGVDASFVGDFVFEDLSNIFLFQHFQGICKAPPFMNSADAVIGKNKLNITKLITSLIESVSCDYISNPLESRPLSRRSSTTSSNSIRIEISDDVENLENESSESIFRQTNDRYQKISSFMPLDIFYIHKVFKDHGMIASTMSLDEADLMSLQSYDYLMFLQPEINSEMAYNMFTQTMKSFDSEKSENKNKNVQISPYEKCFKDSLSNIFSVNDIDRVGLEKVLEFELKKFKKENDTKMTVSLEITLNEYRKNPEILEKYLNYQIDQLTKQLSHNFDLSIQTQLSLNELNRQLVRSSELCTQLSVISLRILINFLMRNYFYEHFAFFNSNIPKYCRKCTKFEEYFIDLSKKCIEIIELKANVNQNDPKIQQKGLTFFQNTLYFSILDQIKLSKFMEIRSDLRPSISKFINEGKWESIPEIQSALKSIDDIVESSGGKALIRAVEMLINALNAESVSITFHIILKTIETVLYSVNEKNEKRKFGIICWVVTHSNVEQLFYIYHFMRHFYWKHVDRLLDIVGNGNIAYWKMFSRVFYYLYKSRAEL
ncbi:hypothetical protein TRFO_33050 [Tritrichomonas foetus]|uniref:Uncharacterized protein n=1 Tax=Tritrichomonas foetus TaxID=1144522 RepID=A0A1J4JSN3_9EUKA|nr:hypothetical protein TRFO_33050 [Tritrichomonas foetus]|eukprot:OHT00269.1 hypothetical protein TRFO_33050 [Tritrichomonas foetus]